MDLRIVIPRNVTFGTCPKCKEPMTLERVKANSILEKKLLSLIKVKKYHCKSCKWYGKLFLYTIPRNYKKVILNYLMLILSVAGISITISFLVKKIFLP
jgi:hypothetical protein